MAPRLTLDTFWGSRHRRSKSIDISSVLVDISLDFRQSWVFICLLILFAITILNFKRFLVCGLLKSIDRFHNWHVQFIMEISHLSDAKMWGARSYKYGIIEVLCVWLQLKGNSSKIVKINFCSSSIWKVNEFGEINTSRFSMLN